MRLNTPAALLCLAAMLMLNAACGSSSRSERRVQQRVEPARFVNPDAPPAPAPVQSTHAARPGPGQADPDPVHRTIAPPEVFSVTPGVPVSVAETSAPVETPFLLDAKVGDINGRPVFASEFLAPISGRLRAEAERLDRDRWIQEAVRIINSELRSMITDELLRAEALSKLTSQQRAGLRRFLEDVRRNMISENLGSRQLAEQRLRQEQGLTEEEYLRQREDRTLVRFTLQEEISDRVNVSWRDIVRRYRRDEDRYNPNPTALLWILRVDAADADAARSVKESLAAGVPFPELAAGPINTWTLDEDGLKLVRFTPPYEEADFFAPLELNVPTRALRPGETAGPITFGSSLIWIHLESIEKSSMDLYDAQIPIAEQIRSERINAELERYIDRLLGRASVTDIERMLRSLVAIATERYAPPPGPPRAPGAR